MHVLLKTTGLSRRFGAVVAARDINVTIAAGEAIGVIGTNGAGKTTFVNMVTGYVRPTAGDIEFCGRSIRALKPREITRLGISRSFQIPQVFMAMSVIENLLMAFAVAGADARSLLRRFDRRESMEKADALLQRFKIAKYRTALAGELPQGVRKLLDIAMAVAGRPRLLLLDEPTSGVSTDEKTALIDIIVDVVREEEITPLIIEHDMDIIARCASRVLAFHQGDVIADGATAQVLADSRVREFVTGA